MPEHSTIRPQADGSVTRWNAQIGRWESTAVAASAAPAPAPPARQASAAVSTAPKAWGKQRGLRMYAAAKQTRQTHGFGAGGNSSSDAELHLSLPVMRARARQMVRDASYAKRAKAIVVNNVIGSGVNMQAQVGTNRAGLNERVNSDIEAAFDQWCAALSCHTGGKLHFNDLERAAFGQIFEAGEVLVRMHYRPFGDSRVPLSLELIEPERLADNIAPPGAVSADGDVRMGVEVDEFQRPIAYWIRSIHPGDVRMKLGAVDRFERVPASDIFHLYIVDRWPQSRGEPWLHTALRKLDELNEYTGLEVSAARGSAAYFATITTPEPENGLADIEEEDGTQVMDLEPLTVQELAPGEELQFHAPNRPNTALDPFMRAMLREVAAGASCSYEAISRDYSQSNYSSSRLSLLDDRETWRSLQRWWIRAFRMPLHKMWLRQAVLARAIESIGVASYAQGPDKFEAVRFKPRGWSWIDPTKEVAAYKEAEKAGYISKSDVIALTGDGRDVEDVVNAQRRDLEMFDVAGIATDTDVAAERAAQTASKRPTSQQPMPSTAADAEDGEGDAADATARARVVSIARSA